MPDPEAVMSRFDDLLLPALQVLGHVSRIDDERSSDLNWVRACLPVGRDSRVQLNSTCLISVLHSTPWPLESLFLIKRFDSIHNEHLLFFCQFRIDR